jgi:hypothetical protein
MDLVTLTCAAPHLLLRVVLLVQFSTLQVPLLWVDLVLLCVFRYIFNTEYFSASGKDSWRTADM